MVILPLALKDPSKGNNRKKLTIEENKRSRLADINKPFFRVELKDTSIENIDYFLKQIASGHIKIGNLNANPPNTNWKNILSNTVSMSDMYTTDSERAGNIHLIVFTTMELSVAGHIQKLGITKDEMGLQVSELHSWLDTTNRDDGQINNVVLIFPVYCRQTTIPRNERYDKIAKYEIHKDLLDQWSAKVIDVTGNTILKTVQRGYFIQIQKMKD